MVRRDFIQTAAAAGLTGSLGQGCSSMVKTSRAPAKKLVRKDLDREPQPSLIVATCQFRISDDSEKNCEIILRQMATAKEKGAEIVHFSETCLGGYAGVDFESFEGYDWNLLQSCTEKVMAKAKALDLWVVLGSNHRLSGDHKPHNSLYLIDNSGVILDRYDKMFCTGDRKETSGDLKHYSPGDHFVVFTVKGITCGLQICHDMRYPELYREYCRRGIQLMFHSYYNGKRTFKNPDNPDENIWKVITEPTMQTDAAENNLWISANNTATVESCWPSFFVRPDGVIVGRLKRNEESVLITTVDTKYTFYDASGVWRDRALNGVYHSGTLVSDPRSIDRTSL